MCISCHCNSDVIHVEQVGDCVVSKSNLAYVNTSMLAESVVVANLVKLLLLLNK